MPDLTPTQMGSRIANSLTGYIAHIPGSFSCRHCELAQEIADAIRAIEQVTERRCCGEIADRMNELASTSPHECCECWRDTEEEFRHRATEGKG